MTFPQKVMGIRSKTPTQVHLLTLQKKRELTPRPLYARLFPWAVWFSYNSLPSK